jgi:hypothetical protein
VAQLRSLLFATGLFREEVKKSQQRNMEKILRKMESESSAAVAQLSQSAAPVQTLRL